ncbi:hypothetical protein IW150_003895 [Coemansia sp. RSA 2607]|nr:hypothetical protein IW150_003895 [Coemansia sp. RSA 2607]
MKTKWGSDLFTWLANTVSSFLAFSRFGTELLFGQDALQSGAIALTMFPVIIFFAAFVQVMYYLGAVQWVLQHLGWFFYKTLGTSNAESIVASASPFVGQSENTLLVMDYLEHMTNSELHACMTAGFATISGSVFQAYVVLGVDARNLITACIMSIPCSLALSKIRYPENDQPAARSFPVKLKKREREVNILHALGNGAATGVHLSLLILATIIAMVSLIYAANFVLTWFGQFVGIHSLTLELILVITLGLVATSKHPRSIQWHTVIVGFLMQFCLGCIVTKTQWGQALFSWLASIASSLLEFSNYGTKFILGDTVGAMTSIFAISVFPAIIFFASFIQVVYYLGGIQWMLKRIGWVFHKTLDISGCESVVTAASPFIGQSENVLLVKDYLPHMTKSEIHACMTAGFATVSGSTLQGYIALGVNAQNIITACIMSIPCSVALSKIRYPETEESLTRGKMVEPPRSTKEVNVLHAVANGAATGINLSLLIAANLIAIISLVHLVDFLLTWFGQFIAIHELTIELILGYVLYPFTWLLGVPAGDVLRVSQLLGLKFVANEFVAYQRLNDASSGPSVSSQLSVRGRTIAEFAFCGFGNLGSIAMQVGALSTLAPGRSGDFSRLAFSACVTGSIATCLSAAIISMVI